MPLAKRFNSALHICVALAALAFAAADGRLLLAAISLAAVGVCWLISIRRVENPPALPRAAINILVLCAIVNAALRAASGPGGESVVSTLGQFLVFIFLIKLLDRRGPRDDAQVLTLSIFVAIAAMLTSADLLVGILLIVFIPTAVATAMLWQLRAGQILLSRTAAEEAPGAHAASNATPPTITPVSGRRPRRAFIGVCAVAVAASCAIATGVFVFVPRVGGEFLGRFGVTRQNMIGFRESVTLGQSGFLNEDPTPVLDLLVTDSKGDNLGSASITQYLRGAARDVYIARDSTWRDSSQQTPGRHGPLTNASAAGPTIKIESGSSWIPRWSDPQQTGQDHLTSRITSQKITMRTDANNIFALWRPISIIPDRTVELTFSRQTGTIRRNDTSWGPRFTYTIQSTMSDDALPAPDAPLGFQSGAIHDYAASVVGPDRVGRQIATTLRDHLQTKFEYTTEMVAPPENRDAIEFFLFDRKKGHCEYFASAMAAMCQSQGIPARVVTGYVAAEFNSLTGQYIVRQSNAHAWVEAFIISDLEAGRGRWERFDASPPAEIERIHRPHGGLLASARAWYEALEFGWTSSFVAFDNISGKRKGDGVLSESVAARRFVVIADRWVAWVKTMVADPSRRPWWLLWSPVILAALVLAVVLVRPLLRKWVPRPRPSLAREYGYFPDRPSGIYARALRTLSRAGVPKPDSTPPARFASDLAQRAPKTSTALLAIARLHYDEHFGGRAPTAPQTAAAQASLRDLAEALRAERPAR